MQNYGTSDEISNAAGQVGRTAADAGVKVGKTVLKKGAKTAAKAAGPVGWLVSAGVEVADRIGLTKILKPLLLCVLCLIIFMPAILAVNGIGIATDVMTHIDNWLHPGNDFIIEQDLGQEDIKEEDRKYAAIVVEAMIEERQRLDTHIKDIVKNKGIDFDNSTIIDNTFIPAGASSGSGASTGGGPEAAADWAVQIANDDRYVRKSFPDRTTRSDAGIYCPICRPEKCKPQGKEAFGWQCIGFVQAAYIHGGNMTEVASKQPDINGGMIDDGTGDRLIRTRDISYWTKSNGPNWEMHEVGKDLSWNDLKKGDCLLFYKGNKYCHTAIYVGDGNLADSAGYLGGPKDIRVHKVYKSYTHTLVIRYTGTVSGNSSANAGKGVNGALEWAKKIAADDSFCYGQPGPGEKGNGQANRTGCYFCGTNDTKVSKSGDKRYNKTYMCQAFVLAAYAHGAGDPDMLKLCQTKGKKLECTDQVWKKNKCWKFIGRAKDVKLSQLQPGDVLVTWDTHMAIYLGNGDTIDARSTDYWGPNSIAIRKGAAKKFLKHKNKSFVMRYVGSASSTASGTSADSILSACKEQAEWMKNYKYGWEKHPTIEKSKTKGTCVTYVACVLQRVGVLQSGQSVWHTGSGKGTGKVTGANSKMTVTYMGNKTFTKCKSSLKAGDIVLVDDNNSGEAGSGGHIMIFAGKWASNGKPYVWDNHSCENVKAGKAGMHTYGKNRKILAIVRVTGSVSASGNSGTTSSGAGSTGGVVSGKRSQSREDVINGACAWAEAIAADDSFHYGHGYHSHHNGCYFCKTQPKVKQKAGIIDWEKTYCCNPFVTAAYAHGGGSPSALKLCKKQGSWWVTDFPKSKYWQNLGKPKVSQLQKGDVLTSSHHVMLYVGNGKIAEAGHSDDNKKGGKSWNSSISVNKVSSKDFSKAYRYVGDYGGVMEIPGGGATQGSFPPCDKETIIQTVTTSTGKRYEIGTISSSNCAQSFAAVGDKFVVAFTKTSNPPTRIGLYSSTGDRLDSIRCDEANHANGSCSTVDGGAYIGGALTANKSIVQCISVDGNKLTRTGNKLMPASASSLAFDKDTKKYILRAGGTMRLFDSNLSNQIKIIKDNMHGRYYQDCGAGGGYAFGIHNLKKGGENSGYSLIDIYNEETSQYCGSIEVKYGELESVDVVNGELVLLVHILGNKNYIHYTGIKVQGGTGSEFTEISRDVAAAIASFSVYESEILPSQFDSLESIDSGFGWLVYGIKEQFRRDIELPTTLRALLNKYKGYDMKNQDMAGGGWTPGLFNITISNEIESKNGKKIAIIEINHQDGDGLAKFFAMDPNGKYSTEKSREKVDGATRTEGEDYTIGETTIAEAIETNTDTHMALLYDNINGQQFERSVLALPIKTLFTRLELSKKFSEDLSGIECKPEEGTKVYSSERGRVEKVVQGDEKYGNYVVIEGYYNIVYAHMKTISVKKGDMVNKNGKIGTSTKLFRMEVYEEGCAVDPEPLFVKKIVLGKDYTGYQPSYGGGDLGGGNSTIAEAAVSIAYEKREQAIGNDGTELYRKVKAQVTGEAHQYFRSCDRVVCTAVRWSGADDSFPLGNCVKQYQHMTGEGKSKWQRVTGIHSESDLQPGDILNCNGHTIVYVGNAEVKKKYPNSNCNLVMGSLSNNYAQARSAACQYDKIIGNGDTITLAYDGRSYRVFRNTNKEANSRYSGVESSSRPTSSSGNTGNVKFDSGSKKKYQEYAYSLFSNYGWGDSEFEPLRKLWNKESGWNPKAHNPSGAHGIPQSKPASKMKSEGSDYYTNGETQIRWGLKYIKGRYGSPSKAWAHFKKNNWY